MRSVRVVVRDDSMRPAFLPGDRLLVDRAEYRRRTPYDGEVVVLRDPEDQRRWLIKRVAAGPGEIVPGVVVPGDPTRVPPRCIFVLSDRAEGARDSRRFGPVPVVDVIGHVWFRTAPATRRGTTPP
ncbi:MAG: S26 family signal peptidase [Thermoplasmata archaeon]|nr:S26 family signal peptidase [Thermoplasmata archaeon]